MHRPSSDQLWHIPPLEVFPRWHDERRLPLPLEAHDASYLAASASIDIFSEVFMIGPSIVFRSA